MRWLLGIIGAIALTGLAVAGWAVAGALADPVVVRYQVALPGLAAPLRLVQLSDSHAGIDMPASRLDRVVAQINALRPDIVVLTGDYVSGDPADWSLGQVREAVAPFAGLKPRLGVLAVVGNHDDPAKTRWAFEGTSVDLLQNEAVSLGGVDFVGADDLGAPARPVERLRKEVRGLKNSRQPIVVLAHEPDFFQYLPRRVGLMVAGHTHGGQIRLPIPMKLSLGPYADAHLRGRFDEGGHVLIVSSGLGTSLLPMRVNVPPELVVIELTPAPATADMRPPAGDHSVGRKSGTDR